MSDSTVAAAIAAVVPQTDTTTTVTTPPAPNTEHIDKFASKFAALTRKERESTEKWKAKDSEYAAKLKDVEDKASKYAPYETLDKDIGADKRKALEFLYSKGLSVEDIGQLLMDDANPDPETKFKRAQNDTESRLMKQIEDLKKSIDEEKTSKIKDEEDAAKKQHEKVVQGVVGDLTEFVNKNEDYELIRTYNSVEMVYNVMTEHYMQQVKKGMPEQLIKILTYKEACDAVEGHLDEQVKKVYEAKRAKQAPKTEQKDPKTTQTLSNTLSSEVPVSGERNLSKEEKMKEAAKMLRWVE